MFRVGLSNRPVIAEPPRAFRCRNGQSVRHRPCWQGFPSLDHGYSIHAGILSDPGQPAIPEEAGPGLCLDTSELVACTDTLGQHQGDRGPRASGRYLFDTAIPALPRRGRGRTHGAGSGTFNLKPHHLPDVRSLVLPSGYVADLRRRQRNTSSAVGDLRVKFLAPLSA